MLWGCCPLASTTFKTYQRLSKWFTSKVLKLPTFYNNKCLKSKTSLCSEQEEMDDLSLSVSLRPPLSLQVGFLDLISYFPISLIICRLSFGYSGQHWLCGQSYALIHLSGSLRPIVCSDSTQWDQVSCLKSCWPPTLKVDTCYFTCWYVILYMLICDTLHVDMWYFTCWYVILYMLIWYFTCWNVILYMLIRDTLHVDMWYFTCWYVILYMLICDTLHVDMWYFTCWYVILYMLIRDTLHVDMWYFTCWYVIL